jgi:hypothetical protein
MRTLDDIEQKSDKKTLSDKVKNLPTNTKIAVAVVVLGGMFFAYRKFFVKKAEPNIIVD